MYLHLWMLFLWALSLSDCIYAMVAEDTAILREDDFDLPHRTNDKFSNQAYPYVHGNNVYDERDRYETSTPSRCSERLENALELIRRRQIAKKKALHLNGFSLHQQLRNAPYDMYVTDMRVRIPTTATWVRVDKCRYDPHNSSLETRLLFNDLTISGRVNLFTGEEIQRQEEHGIEDNNCNMILRLRRAGIGFYTEPIRRERGHFNVRTDSHFLEPGFISVYAYGCEPSKYRGYGKELREEEEDELTREMEDIFLRGIRSLLTSYMQKELQPAIKETLMKNMGYTVSYG